MVLGQDEGGANERIDRIVDHPATAALVAAFFDPAGPFAGDSFDLVGLELSDPGVFGVADLLAVTFMDVVVKPLAARRILGSDSGKLSNLLAAVPADVDLWDAADAELDRAESLWEALRCYDGIDEVTAGKLLARKRPRLIPVVDSVVMNAVRAPDGSYWRAFRSTLQDSGRRGQVERLRPPGLDERVATLRVLDAAVWMTASNGENARHARTAAGMR